MLYSYLITIICIAKCYVCSYFGKLALKEMTFNPQKVFIIFFFRFGSDVSVLTLLRDMSWYCLQDAKRKKRKSCSLFKQIEHSVVYEVMRSRDSGLSLLQISPNEVNLWLERPSPRRGTSVLSAPHRLPATLAQIKPTGPRGCLKQRGRHEHTLGGRRGRDRCGRAGAGGRNRLTSPRVPSTCQASGGAGLPFPRRGREPGRGWAAWA